MLFASWSATRSTKSFVGVCVCVMTIVCIYTVCCILLQSTLCILTLIYERYGILNSHIGKHQMHQIYAIHYCIQSSGSQTHTLPLKHKQDGAVLGPKHRRLLAMESYELLVTGYSWLLAWEIKESGLCSCMAANVSMIQCGLVWAK